MRSACAVFLAVLALAPCRARGAEPAEAEWTEVADGAFDTEALTGRGQDVLRMTDIAWRHAQTEHFVLHYEQAIFARKVARMGEFFYDFIAADLSGAEDRVQGRSHIFVFRNAKKWEDFRRIARDVPAWTFSQVAGTVMYLQQAENTSSSGDVLAHEMTHLVVNRLLPGRPPLWLNEGLAEYYGAFAYAAFKGIKKSRRAQFAKLARPYPLEELFRAETYPASSPDVTAFYATSQYLVGFLLLDHPPEKFLPFMNDLSRGTDVLPAFAAHYGLNGLDEIEKAFRKFAR